MERIAEKFVNNELRIKELSKELKLLRTEKQEISAALINCMQQQNLGSINVEEHKIVIKPTKHYNSLNREYLQESLSSFCQTKVPKDSKLFAEKATEHLLSNRDVIEKQTIKLMKK